MGTRLPLVTGNAIGFIDVTLRDGHQCLWSTRMTTAQMAPILATLDRSGYDIINVMGGAVFDVMVRYLHEDPWQRLRLLAQRLQTPLDALTRGQSLYTFELFPDDVVELNSQVLADCGIKILTVYDALNDNRNIESSVNSGRAAGMKINAMLTYTLSPVHTDEYFVARTQELAAMKVDFISIKDPTGLLTPARGRTLFPAVVAAAGAIPVQLHSHCQSGLGPEVYQVGIESGMRYFYTAIEPLANGASLPATEDIAARARSLKRSVHLNDEALQEYSDYWSWIAVRDGKPRGMVAQYDEALYEHQVPGGMISNLRSQLATMKMENRMGEILEETARVRHDLGYPILVSPFAQYIVTQAVLNVVQGERYKTIPDEVKRYAQGYYGRLAARPSGEFLARAEVNPGELSNQRAAAHIEPWLPKLRARLGAKASDERVLLSAFYDDSLLAALTNPTADYPIRTAPLHELLKHLCERKDYQHLRARFANTDISLSCA